jgi:hypothetical protein
MKAEESDPEFFEYQDPCEHCKDYCGGCCEIDKSIRKIAQENHMNTLFGKGGFKRKSNGTWGSDE